MPEILERAARHEAGHAVTHRHFGRRVSFIFITADGSGITSITQSVQGVGKPRQPTSMVPDHAQLVAVMAGRAAEAIQYPTLPRNELVELSKFDEQKARDFVRELYGSSLSDDQVTAYVRCRRSRSVANSSWGVAGGSGPRRNTPIAGASMRS
jgi:ATP-dependent Zn protease